MNTNATGVTGNASTGLSGSGALISLVALTVIFFAVPKFFLDGDETAQKTEAAAKPVIPTRTLKCDNDDAIYPWIGFGMSVLVVPPADCWTEWQGVGEGGAHSRNLDLLIEGRGIKRRYRYGDGSVGPVVEPKPFSDRRFGHPTAVQFKNGGKEEVKIKAEIR